LATVINFDVCLDNACDTLTLTETTGAYSASNLTGWGAPNEIISNITVALLQVTSPSGTVSTIDLLSPVSGLPSSNPSLAYTILNADLGNITTVEDGHWQFLLHYRTAGGTIYQKVRNYLFYCNTECCVQELLADIEITDCDCCKQEDIDKINNYTKAKTFLESLKNAARCYQVSNFESIQAVLTKLCRNSTCKNC